jgi:TPR repeat protein
VLENCLTRELRKLWDEIRKRENAAFWERTDAWEESASNYNELLASEPEERWILIERGNILSDSSPTTALKFYAEAAEAGSVWSMEKVGWQYWTGTGVVADTSLALDYYHRAILGGSWSATIPYARLLAEVGRQEDCENYLRECVASDFVPAYFWLAWLRYKRDKTSTVRREVRPLLEYAARQGHPGARGLLVRWMARGQLGLLNVPRGWVNVVREAVAESRED